MNKQAATNLIYAHHTYIINPENNNNSFQKELRDTAVRILAPGE